MRTTVLVPHAEIEVRDGELTVHFDHQNEEIDELSSIQYQLCQRHSFLPGYEVHGICIMTTYNPGVMWVHGNGLFYRLLFTINAPSEPGYMTTIFQYEVKVWTDYLDVIAGWRRTDVFPTLASIKYRETEYFDARPLFTEEMIQLGVS